MDSAHVSIVVAVLSILISASALGYSFSALSGISSRLQDELGGLKGDSKTVSDRVRTLSSDLEAARKTTEGITTEGKAIRELVEKRLGGISAALEEANKKLAEAEKARLAEAERVRNLEKELARTRMIDAARAEGKVVIYSTITTETMDALKEAFTRLYGIKVEAWRAATDKLIEKVTAETIGKQYSVDVIANTEPAMLYFKSKGWLARYISPEAAAYGEKWKDPDGTFVYYDTFGAVWIYNKKLVRPEEVPKTLKDILDPKWKNRISIPNPLIHITTLEWFGTLKSILGDKEWKSWVEGLAKQGPLLSASLSPAGRMVMAGESAIGLGGSSDMLTRIAAGDPIDFIPIKPILMTRQGPALYAYAPNPNAGKLFIDFLLSAEGQTIMAKDRLSARPGVPSPATKYYTIEEVAPFLVFTDEDREKLSKELAPYFK